MILRNKLAHTPSKRLKTDVKLDFDFTSEDVCNCINVERKGKGVGTVYSTHPYRLKGNAKLVFSDGKNGYFVTERGYFITTDAYYCEILLSRPTGELCYCAYRDGIIVSSSGYVTDYLVGKTVIPLLQDGFSDLTCCNDRVFGLNNQEVVYAEAGTADGWSNGQTLTLATPCDALVTVGGKVYALGNTCYAISPDAEDVAFKLTHFASNVGTVSRTSIVNYDDKALFASRNGLYLISSNKITPIFQRLNEFFDMSDAAATYFKGKVYLSCKSRRNDAAANDVTLCLDIDDEEVCGVLDGGYSSLAATDTYICGVKGIEGISFSESSAYGVYVKSNIDFDCSAKKFLDALTIKTFSDITLTIRSENETRMYTLTGKNSEQKIKIRGMGWRFSIELTASSGLYVDKLQLEAHVCEEV